MHNNPDKLRQPFYILLGAVSILVLLSCLDQNIIVPGYEIKKIDIVSEVRRPPKKKMARYIPADTIAIVPDSTTVIQLPVDMRSIVDFSTDSIPELDRFFAALYALEQKKKKKVRVAYFGDSMVEGDLMTQDMRDSLQKLYGGRGVGFVPVTSIVAGFRRTIIHSFSEDWTAYNLSQPASPDHPLGLSGYVFSPAPNSSVTYTAPRYSYFLSSFRTVKLYYGKGNDSCIVNATLDKTIAKEFRLNGKKDVNELILSDSSAIRTLTLEFKCQTPIFIYGASFETEDGIHLDNYSFRGNSGLALTKIPTPVYHDFNECFDYDLVVLHYGLNVAGHNCNCYSSYETGLERLIGLAKRNFPHASILVISVNDKSWKSPEGWQTEPDIPILAATQQRAAEKKGVAFWNLYEAMGGENSMVHWVEGDTVLANKDYAHPNFKGSKKISNMLMKELLKKYEEYKKKQQS